jgi:UDP-N-acetylmuramyl pentapeptide synthase
MAALRAGVDRNHRPNGKTTTKEMLAVIRQLRATRALATSGNLNTDIGVSFTLPGCARATATVRSSSA